MDMRIGNSRRAKAVKRAHNSKSDIITKRDIDSVPLPDAFIDNDINLRIQQEAKNVLNMSMNNGEYAYCECAILFSTCDDEKTFGDSLNNIYNQKVYKCYRGNELGHIEISIDTLFGKTLIYRTKTDLIVVHNHPNNSSFSGNDIITLCKNSTLSCIVAVGNKNNMFILIKAKDGINKTGKYILDRVEKLLEQDYKNGLIKTQDDREKLHKKHRDAIAREILSLSEKDLLSKFGLIYHKYNRRCKV